MTLKFFFTDKIKKMCIMLPLNAAIMSGVVWVINKFGEHFYIYAWGFVSAVVIVMMYVYPEFIAPIFDTYSPLKEGELKSKVGVNNSMVATIKPHYKASQVTYYNENRQSDVRFFSMSIRGLEGLQFDFKNGLSIRSKIRKNLEVLNSKNV